MTIRWEYYRFPSILLHQEFDLLLREYCLIHSHPFSMFHHLIQPSLLIFHQISAHSHQSRKWSSVDNYGDCDSSWEEGADYSSFPMTIHPIQELPIATPARDEKAPELHVDEYKWSPSLRPLLLSSTNPHWLTRMRTLIKFTAQLFLLPLLLFRERWSTYVHKCTLYSRWNVSLSKLEGKGEGMKWESLLPESDYSLSIHTCYAMQIPRGSTLFCSGGKESNHCWLAEVSMFFCFYILLQQMNHISLRSQTPIKKYQSTKNWTVMFCGISFFLTYFALSLDGFFWKMLKSVRPLHIEVMLYY